MLDFFVLFGKGGIVLWCFQSTKEAVLTSVNALIRSVILQERGGDGRFEHEQLMLQFKLDNEFDLVFVVGYQKVLKLNYVDKFLDDIHLEVRDRYKNELLDKRGLLQGLDLSVEYESILHAAEVWSFELAKQPKTMKSFDESKKSKKTVASMIETKGGGYPEPESKKGKKAKAPAVAPTPVTQENNGDDGDSADENGEGDGEEEENVDPFSGLSLPIGKQVSKGPGGRRVVKVKSPKTGKDKGSGKKPRTWDQGGTTRDLAELDRSRPGDAQSQEFIPTDRSIIGKMSGHIKALEVRVDDSSSKKGKEGGNVVTNLFKGLVGGKALSDGDVAPALEKLKDHLISKNVAADVSLKICDSVSKKLEGKVLGTFQTVNSTVKSALEESLLTLLRPKKQVDVLRDALEAKRQQRPFVITFCGVNGVGKSTNLAKICYWLIENDFRVLVAACDTFRAGAVEQLRTHARHLNALHPPKGGIPMVQLYEKGYGKDAAGVAAEAISFAKDARLDVVLVDTAGRMQDNEPLMRALSKLIRVNDPDLVLFVGEALVGNEAVDQLVKFNRALADFSDQNNPRLIDGIVLTKFDTIDDKVGAAVSMAYITGQPIVFVGTGQTYTDLRTLDSQAVVASLMN
ncbi:signal recognition particle receptor subunit alpha homolog [Folsomia candida]|uniref:Signal recognition particle receptor subunit alpha n=1 Tax=Folsomia candida TaxID=158441 RepID=A0A226DCI6_FOLCA|nr:signal recognition particle receptor subunit alpha homolog [Folsomia candida]OXA42638.1 Signal recognition particle receptor subunit alpha [Folsomia candida]